MPRRAIQLTERTVVPTDVGARIRQVRGERGLSLAQLAGSELTRGFISAVEHGRSSLSLKTLAYIADRLDLPVTYFLAGQEVDEGLLQSLQLDEAEQQLRTQHPAEALGTLAGVAESIQDPRFQWLKGWALLGTGRAREAIPILHDAFQAVETNPDTHHVLEVQYTLVQALYGAGNYDEALEHLREAHARADESGDEALLGKMTVALGHIYFVQGKRDIALAQYARARELFQGVSDPVNLAAVYGGLSRLHRQQGDLRAAIKYARMGLGIWSSRQNQREAAHELANIAARYDEVGDSEMAITTAEEAIATARDSHSPDIEALARSSLAAAYLRQGDLDHARAEAEAVQALQIAEDDLGTIDARIVLAKMAELTGDAAQADTLYQQVLAALEQSGRSGRYADVALAYSEALAARGDMSDAFDYARRAAAALTARPA
jgi:HTH-type transcriptional regulator, quorum sensing regulator NprR